MRELPACCSICDAFRRPWQPGFMELYNRCVCCAHKPVGRLGMPRSATDFPDLCLHLHRKTVLLQDSGCADASARICSNAACNALLSAGQKLLIHAALMETDVKCVPGPACMHQAPVVLPHQSLHHCCQPGRQPQYVSSALMVSVWQLCWAELVWWKGWGPSLCPPEANAYRAGDALPLQPKMSELARPLSHFVLKTHRKLHFTSACKKTT